MPHKAATYISIGLVVLYLVITKFHSTEFNVQGGIGSYFTYLQFLFSEMMAVAAILLIMAAGCALALGVVIGFGRAKRWTIGLLVASIGIIIVETLFGANFCGPGSGVNCSQAYDQFTAKQPAPFEGQAKSWLENLFDTLSRRALRK